MAEQELFDFSDDLSKPNPLPALELSLEPAQKTYSWSWGDAWPDGLTHRQYLVMQIVRDKRALEEETDPEYQEFFTNRISAYQQTVRAMDGDEQSSQQTPPATDHGAQP